MPAVDDFDYLGAMIDDRRVLRRQVAVATERLSWLVGRYGTDGAVPVDEVRAVLDAVNALDPS